MDSQAGHSPEQPPDASVERRWLTYDELGHTRGIGRESAVKLAQRKRWSRRPGNDGTARVCVPLDWLKAANEHSGERSPEHSPDHSGELSRTVSLLEATLAALREQQGHERAGWAEDRTRLIVVITYAHRPKRPPRKAQAAAIIIGPAIVTNTSRRRSKQLSAERAAPDTDAANVSPEVKAFFARMVRPGGALPPKQ